jgi:hypothetical protein
VVSKNNKRIERRKIMNKINFQNGITPLNDTNLNQMQTNIENAINEKTINITTGVEFETGRIIDGKVEYGKRIDCGALPDGTGLRTIAHRITNFMVTKIEAYAYSSAYGRWMTLPLVENGESSAYNVSFNIDTTNITLNSDKTQEHYTACITIYYIKN